MSGTTCKNKLGYKKKFLGEQTKKTPQMPLLTATNTPHYSNSKKQNSLFEDCNTTNCHITR